MQDAHGIAATGGHDLYAVVLLLASERAARSDFSPSSLEQGDTVPLRYQPAALGPAATTRQAARQLCLASLWQLCGNLLLLCEGDDPEIVHQARIGWRRLRGDLRLFEAVKGAARAPSPQALKPMVEALGRLRDLDVARLEVLPHWQRAMAGAGAERADEWQRVAALLDAAARRRREQLRALLREPAVGAALWSYALWAGALAPSLAGRRRAAGDAPRDWARRRVADIRRKLRRSERRAATAQALHRRRIWAKRLRYATEELQGLLPRKAGQWHEHALDLQTRLGQSRDIANTAELVERLGAHELAACLRGIAAAGLAQPLPPA